MQRRWIWLGLGLVACSVEVGEGNAGLSAGTSDPGPSPTSAAATDGADDEPHADTDPGTSSTEPSADTVADATDSDAGPGPTGSATDDGTTTGSGSTGPDDGAPGDPLDPDLDVPDGGAACTTPGSLAECPALEVCRFHTTEQGRCESCDACGNLGAPCVQGTDCDILFACYQGQCTNICELGTYYCGPIEDCLDVGHPTHGVCAPR